MKEVLLGYDSRVLASASIENWDAKGRETFLLKSSIDRILSVDNYHWASVADVLKIALPQWIGFVQDLWADLDKLHAFIKRHDEAEKLDYWTIGVTQFFDEPLEKTSVTHFPFNPPSVQDDWTLLGYDIAEETCDISGLSSFSYKTTTKAYALKHFAPALNDDHLFDDLDIAQKFALWNDTRDPGHGPWYVTGLYRIP